MKLPHAATLVAILILASGCGRERIALAAARLGVNRSASDIALAGSPLVILWAWQRPVDLRFINPHRTGVAYLVETIHLRPGGFRVEPNQNGLEVPEGTWVMACARIDSNGDASLAPQARLAGELAAQLARLAQFPNARAVQLDFDATVSQRGYYRQLLLELRRRLPSSVPLSITALASWCEGDDWISHLPVDEAVPMLFRMGPDRASVLLQLEDGGDFSEPLCRKSAGISTDEFVPRLPAGRRLYIFNAAGWTKSSFEKIRHRFMRVPPLAAGLSPALSPFRISLALAGIALMGSGVPPCRCHR